MQGPSTFWRPFSNLGTPSNDKILQLFLKRALVSNTLAYQRALFKPWMHFMHFIKLEFTKCCGFFFLLFFYLIFKCNLEIHLNHIHFLCNFLCDRTWQFIFENMNLAGNLYMAFQKFSNVIHRFPKQSMFSKQCVIDDT